MTDFDPNDRGEYAIGPEPAPNPPRLDRPRMRISTSLMSYDVHAPGRAIPYARPMPAPEPERGIATSTQYVLGGLSPFAYGTVVSLIMGALRIFRPPIAVQELMVWVAFGGFAALVVFVHVKLGWKGFLPGILTAIFVLPLILFAICGVVLLGIGSAGGFR